MYTDQQKREIERVLTVFKIHSAEEICDKCYTEIGNDILLENDREYELWQMHKLERDEFLRRVQPYDAQLPEYHYLIERLLSPPAQAK